MKWLTTTVVVAIALAINSCAEGQDDINFVMDQEDANAKGIRGQQQLIKSSRFKFENEVLGLVDTLSPLLLKKTLIEKRESVGVLSDDKENIASVHHQDEIVKSVTKDFEFEHRQVQQGRRLDSGSMDLATFEARCVASAEAAYPLITYSNPSDAYVDCVDGRVSGSSQTCANACGDFDSARKECCTGFDACNGFTGKGK